MVIACAQGGTSIEDLAEEDPDQIIKVPIDSIVGMTDEDAAEIVQGLQIGAASPWSSLSSGSAPSRSVTGPEAVEAVSSSLGSSRFRSKYRSCSCCQVSYLRSLSMAASASRDKASNNASGVQLKHSRRMAFQDVSCNRFAAAAADFAAGPCTLEKHVRTRLTHTHAWAQRPTEAKSMFSDSSTQVPV